ncbi:hypothetical protein ABLE68_00110 [Nocardioides sp. CN2-186]|uniref:hypothetical protein n=1 Tax=Nocardioides tweenelious TaxID=3156607 RepID=UPI0032B34042
MTALPTYDPEQLVGVLEILPGVDDVELKLTVPATDHRAVVQSLEIDSIDAVVRQVAFIDTLDLRLSAAGLVLRVRRTQRKPADVTVKLRPMLPADVPEGLRSVPGFKVELDASPTGYACSCSLTAELSDGKAKDVLAGKRSVLDVLTDVQRTLVMDRLPESLDVADLRVLGPVHLLKCRFEPTGYPRRMVAELWFLPDGTRILELSAKSAPGAAFQAAAETKVFLNGLGIDLGAPQEMKTRSALAALVAALDKE